MSIPVTPHRADIYSRVTDRIIADLEQGVRPWTKPRNAEHAAGRITRPLRHNGTPYRGINILLLDDREALQKADRARWRWEHPKRKGFLEAVQRRLSPKRAAQKDAADKKEWKDLLTRHQKGA